MSEPNDIPNNSERDSASHPRLVRLELVLAVNEALYGTTEEEIEWFRDHVLLATEDTILHSNVIGEEIGALRSVKILEANAESNSADLSA